MPSSLGCFQGSPPARHGSRPARRRFRAGSSRTRHPGLARPLPRRLQPGLARLERESPDGRRTALLQARPRQPWPPRPRPKSKSAADAAPASRGDGWHTRSPPRALAAPTPRPQIAERSVPPAPAGNRHRWQRDARLAVEYRARDHGPAGHSVLRHGNVPSSTPFSLVLGRCPTGNSHHCLQ